MAVRIKQIIIAPGSNLGPLPKIFLCNGRKQFSAKFPGSKLKIMFSLTNRANQNLSTRTEMLKERLSRVH